MLCLWRRVDRASPILLAVAACTDCSMPPCPTSIVSIPGMTCLQCSHPGSRRLLPFVTGREGLRRLPRFIAVFYFLTPPCACSALLALPPSATSISVAEAWPTLAHPPFGVLWDFQWEYLIPQFRPTFALSFSSLLFRFFAAGLPVIPPAWLFVLPYSSHSSPSPKSIACVYANQSVTPLATETLCAQTFGFALPPGIRFEGIALLLCCAARGRFGLFGVMSRVGCACTRFFYQTSMQIPIQIPMYFRHNQTPGLV